MKKKLDDFFSKKAKPQSSISPTKIEFESTLQNRAEENKEIQNQSNKMEIEEIVPSCQSQLPIQAEHESKEKAQKKNARDLHKHFFKEHIDNKTSHFMESSFTQKKKILFYVFIA